MEQKPTEQAATHCELQIASAIIAIIATLTIAFGTSIRKNNIGEKFAVRPVAPDV
jgi:hypothetical protein